MFDKNTLAQHVRQLCTISGHFTLKSGITSEVYFDKYLFESNPLLLINIAREMCKIIPIEYDALAGLEMGGVPIATAMSISSGKPSAFIRKQPKQYGTCKYAEGVDLTNKRVLIVEDVVTSGSAVVEAIDKLIADNITIVGVVSVLDREQGGTQAITRYGIPFYPLFDHEDMWGEKI